MNSFAITYEQMVKLAMALAADELARNFNHYTDFIAQADWTAETPLGAGGLDLDEKRIAACAERLCSFFDKPATALDPQAEDTFGQWATRIMPEVERSLTHLQFLPATQGGDAASRHGADQVWQDARAVASLMHGRRRVLSMIGTHSLSGFTTTVLAPNLQALEVIDARRLTPEELGQMLDFGDLLIATPTLWRYLVQTMPVKFANNLVGISLGAPLPLELALELREKGLGAMRELYGSTETGLVAWRDTPAEPFVLFDHWSYEEGMLVRASPDGRQHKVLAMDHLAFEGARTFQIQGRRDGAVQIGAVNVFPGKISEIIAGHDQINACEVRVTHRKGTLDQLVAHVWLAKQVSADERMAWRLDEWCRKKLRPQERPRIYVFEAEEAAADPDA